MTHRSCRSAVHRAAVVLALACAGLAPAAAGAGEPPATDRGGLPPADPAPFIHAAAMKQQQVRLLLEGARQRMARAKASARLLSGHPGQVRPGARVRRPGDWIEAGGPQGAGRRAATATASSGTQAAAALVPNVLVNDRSQDASYTTVGQAEQMIAALGQNVLVAWNDGLGFETGGSTQGYAYSLDGGATYTDGGAPPVPPSPAGWKWTSDPLVVVDESSADFWYCSLVDIGTTQNGVAVVKARFEGGAPTWSAPTLVRVGGNASVLFDKPWLAVDPSTHRLYLSYTVFGSKDTIVFQRSSAAGASWDNPVRLSANSEANYVQGSRPAVGPDGEVYVVWYSIEPSSPYADHMRIRKSTNQGSSFGAATDVATVYSNYGSGAPGFNRGMGITYPAIAVDRSSGAHRGRVYVAWNEGIDFYDDLLGNTGSLSETEPNDLPLEPDPFTVGKVVRGTVSSTSDFDYFSFAGTAGQTVIFFADSVASGLNMSLRVFCSDLTTRLALSAFGTGQQDLICFTLPATGTYFMRCASWDNIGTGGYRIQTGFDAPSAGDRSRDHRDVFVSWSDGGSGWSTPARASDSPAGYDDWLPEVAVGGDHADPRVGSGKPYCLWYDWRDAPAQCGGSSQVYLARSDDGGVSWVGSGVITSAPSAWTSVGSNIAPNQGDYLALFANDVNLYAAWADGRNGDPDVYAVTVPLLTTPVEVALAGVQAEPDRVTLVWYTGAASGFSATVERRETATGFAAIGTVSADGSGNAAFTDVTVTPAARYAYRLTWREGATERATAEIWVDVPAAAAFALHGAQPNPAVRGVSVSLALPDAAPATLELLDVAGRRVCARQVTGAGAHRVDLSGGLDLEPGIYVIRLTQGNRSLTTRVTVVR